ncbi:MAG TPA: asparagine synthase (glutamine-hydrolyzing) [Gemmatimonadales bacterium]|jgi:asparagine synthase (glutamine-hydrolysing)|nr:asparagine synthase (glutamine-hydrolyzing) [Gemmatimonadales bacterium]
MCGIVAVRTLDGAQTAAAFVNPMVGTLAHRGPDDAGVFFEGDVGLGFKRLAILDLSATGHQPMPSADGSAVLVFNGEIFNYVELREELRALGHSFRSTGDAEVLLHAYLQWGVDCLPRCNGEWAFVIYDRRTGSLFGARDRFGIKPLYHACVAGALVWASEIKAVLALRDLRRSINWRAAGPYLLSGTLDHLTDTFFAGVQAVPAGSAFLVGHDGRQRAWRYWSLPAPDAASVTDPPASFAELFEDAVRIRLRSDVPLGVCLSGGLDSTAVICAMDRVRRSNGSNGQQVTAFTYHHPNFDERRYVDATVNRTGAKVHWLEMDHVALWDLAEPVMRAHDEPVHTLTAMVGYELMRMIAGRGIKVILNGQGADETLAGYDSYFRAAWYSDLRRGRPWRAWSEIRRYTAVHGGASRRRLVALVEHLVKTELRRTEWYRTLAHQRQRRRAERDGWFRDVALPAPDDVPPFEAPDLDTILRRSTTVDPLPLYLRVEDRNSMAHSVEVRLPMLDYRLVEFLFRLANDWKIRGPLNKYLLREAMRGRIPEIVRTRADKMGFPSPFRQLLDGKTFDAVFDLVTSRRARERGVYDSTRIARDLEAHRDSSNGEIAWRAFRVAQLELWAQLHGL